MFYTLYTADESLLLIMRSLNVNLTFLNTSPQVLHGKQECYNVEQRLKTKSEEYESLYSEHDEEVIHSPLFYSINSNFNS